MKTTKHASIRKRQRGFSDSAMEIIYKYGKSVKAPGKAMKIVLTNKDYQQIVSEFKKAIQLMDKAKGGQMIVSDDNIITVYK